MKKLYRIEISTFWPHPNGTFGKWREMVYDFVDADLADDERDWFNGQDFYDPQQSPQIYAQYKDANDIFCDIDWKKEDWEPLEFLKGSGEFIVSFRLVSVDECGNETVEAEIVIPESIRRIEEIRDNATASTV